jgi:hypothetical protein
MIVAAGGYPVAQWFTPMNGVIGTDVSNGCIVRGLNQIPGILLGAHIMLGRDFVLVAGSALDDLQMIELIGYPLLVADCVAVDALAGKVLRVKQFSRGLVATVTRDGRVGVLTIDMTIGASDVSVSGLQWIEAMVDLPSQEWDRKSFERCGFGKRGQRYSDLLGAGLLQLLDLPVQGHHGYIGTGLVPD